MNEVRVMRTGELGFVTSLKKDVFTVKLHRRFRADAKDSGERVYVKNELHFILKEIRKEAVVNSRKNGRCFINFQNGKWTIAAKPDDKRTVLCYSNGNEILYQCKLV